LILKEPKFWRNSRATFRGIQDAYFQHRKGLISDEVWRDYEQVLTNQSGVSHINGWWRTERKTSDREFVDVYEALFCAVSID
jgi:hypothetical protein